MKLEITKLTEGQNPMLRTTEDIIVFLVLLLIAANALFFDLAYVLVNWRKL